MSCRIFYQLERVQHANGWSGDCFTFSTFVRFLCLFVHLHLSHAQYVTSYVTMQLQYVPAFGGLQAKQMKVVVCCVDGENLVGSHKDFSRCIATNWKYMMKLLCQHFRCTTFDCLSTSTGCLL